VGIGQLESGRVGKIVHARCPRDGVRADDFAHPIISMQARPLEKAAALARFDLELHGFAVAVDRERHVDAGVTERPA